MTEEKLKKEIVAISRLFYERGWSPATSSNYSARIRKNRIVITMSGKDKSALTKADTMVVNLRGEGLRPESAIPSAETLLHCRLYDLSSEIGAVLHTHSKYSTLLSLSAKDRLTIQGYEMLKALRGVTTHEHTEVIPILPNHQDMNLLSRLARQALRKHSDAHAFLIAGHGLYTWGRDLSEAKRHIEAFEFLFECEYLRR